MRTLKMKTPKAVGAAKGANETVGETSLAFADSTIPAGLKLAAAWLVASHLVRPELAAVVAEAARLGGGQ